MAVKPMLGDLELQLVDEIESDQDRVLQEHPVPGLEGDLTTDVGRRATTITLTGALAGEKAGADLKALREKFLTAQPVAFAADIATAARVQDVLIEEMGVRALAGRPELYEYSFTLREFVPAPAVPQEPPPVIPPPPIPPTVGTLEVEVVVEGRPDFDLDLVTVTVVGNQADGAALKRTLTSCKDNVWTEPAFPPGTYTARATVVGPPPLQGEAAAVVRPGALTHVKITLRPAPTLATTFVVHFHFDKAFVEPCMRTVLAQVAAYAKAHPDQRLLVVGHTDLTGSDTYNQSLSERRARATFAMLTTGSDPASAQAARAEWDQLRRPHPSGTTRSLNDSWGRREQQWILQDLGLYQGNIDTETPPPENVGLTRDAVARFQTGRGLAPSGTVDDATWAALIDAYLARDPLSVDPGQLLPNAAGGCDGGPLKWLGCGEKDPVEDTEDAERRNRRVELLFVRADHLPADVRKPDTFDLPAPGSVSPRWCLNASNTTTHTCFVRPHPQPRQGRPQAKETCTTPDAARFSRQPAEPGDVAVSGNILFEDGSPLADTPFVLIAPSGKIMTDEHRRGTLSGWPIAGRTGSDGRFAFTDPQGIGVYTLEVRAPVVARRKGEPLSSARGNVVCARLADPATVLEVVVTSLAAASVHPSLSAPTAVVVRKPGSNPPRQWCRLSVDAAFTGSGTFTRSSDAVRFFDPAVGVTEMAFDGTDNVFTAAQLRAGIELFAEGRRASAAVDDVELRLALTVAGQPGHAAEARMTAVELTLDVCASRTAPVVDPPPLANVVKLNPGRFLHTALPDLSHERAMLLVRPPVPAGFVGDLVLTPITDGVQAFAEEVPATGQTAVATATAALVLPAVNPPAERRVFAEGVKDSPLGGDTGFHLGLAGIEPEGDRATMTVGRLDVVEAATAAAPAVTSVRVGLWDHAFDAAGIVAIGQAENANFVGADSRRFYFRLRDVSRSGSGATDIEWRTVRENGDDFFTPTDRHLTLVESAAGSGVFISRAVLLVTDEDDQNQVTPSGLPAVLPPDLPATPLVATRNQRNHRLRRADVRSRVLSTYPQRGVPGVQVSRTTPVFARTPTDDRRRLPLQIFVLRVAPGGNGVVPTLTTSPIFARDLRFAEECYARLGIVVETVVRPGTAANDVVSENRLVPGETVSLTGPGAFVLLRPPVVDDPRNHVVLHHGGAQMALRVVTGRVPGPGEVALDLTTGRLTLASQPAPGDRLVATYVSVGHRVVLIEAPPGVNNPRSVTLANEAVIAAAHPALAHTIRVFYTGGLASTNHGESGPEIDFAGAPDVAACFINGATEPLDTTAHEVGHVLTNKSGTVNTGHYVRPALPAGNQFFTNQNLMLDGTSNLVGVAYSKRLWDAADVDGLNQFTEIRRSHFLRAF
ncbi:MULTISPECIES: OmpA family protein [unclassified Frankia]|uniref:OmpA family protein n=1 Tax=unclassified Frankia TaxID=2632575 RepID=UPI002AD5ABF2|nr:MULTISPECIES: OmpA family protein [unclassified Frankia]